MGRGTVRCTLPRTRAAVGEEAGEAGAAARCCCRADGNVALAAMLDAGAGTAGIVGVAAPSAPVPFAVVGCGGGARSRRTTTRKRKRKSWRGSLGGEGKLGCELAEAGWSAKGVSSDACVGAVAVDGSGLAGSGSVRSSQRAAMFSVDAMAGWGDVGGRQTTGLRRWWLGGGD
jgi:hypothetical protein